MKSQTIALVLGVVFCAVLAQASAGGKGDWKKMMKKCGDGEINVEEAFKGMKECKAEMTPTTPEDEQPEPERRRRSPGEGGRGKGKRGKGKWMKNMCVAVCGWKKQGLLDDSGAFLESGVDSYVEKVYPEGNRAEITELMKACGNEHKANFSMEDNCKGYKKFKKCIMGAHMKTCKIEMPKRGKKPEGGASEGGDSESGADDMPFIS